MPLTTRPFEFPDSEVMEALMSRLRSLSSPHAILAFLASISFIYLAPTEAQAFCGFYVSGADQEMYNNATMVVMMREGTKTVLSMRNNYEGPPEDFAMVIPVPQVLEEENVKVLKDEVFTRVDQLAAPRLVEYWEQDPCLILKYKEDAKGSGNIRVADYASGGAPGGGLGVTVEAQFDVGEYNVVILSAKESNGLEKWLEQEKYNIPKGAAPVLKPYIEGGQYFFVAKVDPKKVTFKDGQAQLSPLRFHYDSKEFSLPVRLGLLNAKGHQDLLVHILAKKQRYEVANYKNVTIPTNILVKDHVRDRFAEFYATLLDRTLEENPKAVITEYSWDASTCDPCPVPALRPDEIMSLGGDIIQEANQRGVVLTRLHARYTKDDLEEDLIFKKADPIVGGRGTPSGENPKMAEEGSKPGSYNNFQGRYIMLNEWTGDVKCRNPKYGVWGGSGPQASAVSPNSGGVKNADGAVVLADLIREDISTLGQQTNKPFKNRDLSSGRCSTSMGHAPMQGPAGLLLLTLGFVGLARRRAAGQAQ